MIWSVSCIVFKIENCLFEIFSHRFFKLSLFPWDLAVLALLWSIFMCANLGSSLGNCLITKTSFLSESLNPYLFLSDEKLGITVWRFYLLNCIFAALSERNIKFYFVSPLIIAYCLKTVLVFPLMLPIARAKHFTSLLGSLGKMQSKSEQTFLDCYAKLLCSW